MEWQFIVALVVAIPFILIPVAFIWFLNIGGIVAAIRQGQKERGATREEVRAVAEEQPAVAGAVPQEQPAITAAKTEEQPAVTVGKVEEVAAKR